MRERIIRMIEKKREDSIYKSMVRHYNGFSMDDIVKQLILEVISFDLGSDVTEENIEDARAVAEFHGWTDELEQIISSVQRKRQKEEVVQSG